MALGVEIHEQQEGVYSLSLNGELDLASARKLEAAVRPLCENGARAMTLDLSELAFIDSTGLAAIVLVSALCGKHECGFELVPGQRSVQRLFEIAGLLHALPFRDGAPSVPSG